MRSRLLRATALFAFFLTPTLLSAQSDEAAVEATVAAYHDALADGDSATALSLLADDVLVLESGGLETREEYRSHHLPGDMRFASTVARERGPMTVRIRGDVAWAVSLSTVSGSLGERTIDAQSAELMVLVRQENGWKISAIHWSSRSR